MLILYSCSIGKLANNYEILHVLRQIRIAFRTKLLSIAKYIIEHIFFRRLEQNERERKRNRERKREIERERERGRERKRERGREREREGEREREREGEREKERESE